MSLLGKIGKIIAIACLLALGGFFSIFPAGS